MKRFAALALVMISGFATLGAQAMDKSAYDVKNLGPQVTAYTNMEALTKLTAMPGTTTVLYFAATWCPSCQAFYRDLQANFKNLPKDVNLVFVNYDKEMDLKKKHGVTGQHTYVQVDAQGMKKMLWVGGSSVMDLLKKLGKV